MTARLRPRPPVGRRCAGTVQSTRARSCPGRAASSPPARGVRRRRVRRRQLRRRAATVGKLTCSRACTIDDTTCAERLPIGGPLASCGRRRSPFHRPSRPSGSPRPTPRSAIAQVDTTSDNGRHAARRSRALDRTLGVLGATGLEDMGQAGPLQDEYIDGVAVAPHAVGLAGRGLRRVRTSSSTRSTRAGRRSRARSSTTGPTGRALARPALWRWRRGRPAAR